MNDENPLNAPMMELPKYRCHKEVWALKIKHLRPDPDSLPIGSSDAPGLMMIPEDSRYGQIWLDPSWVGKHAPEVGGYFVAYADGYTSYSPAEAFESGYTLIPYVDPRCGMGI